MMTRWLRAVAGGLYMLDAWLLSSVTQASHRWQRWFGHTSYRQAAVAFTWLILTQGMDAADYWWPNLLSRRDTGLPIVVLSFLVALMCGHVRRHCHRADSHYDGGEVLPLSVRWLEALFSPMTRIIQLPFFAITSVPITIVMVLQGDWPHAVTASQSSVLVLGMYLANVRPQRRGPTRVQEIAEEIRAGLQLPASTRAGA